MAVGFGARESGTSGNDRGVKHFLLRCVCLLCWGSFLKNNNSCLLNIQQPYLAIVFLLLNKKNNICAGEKTSHSRPSILLLSESAYNFGCLGF